jgi:trk system potassium uptake protein TrkA
MTDRVYNEFSLTKRQNNPITYVVPSSKCLQRATGSLTIPRFTTMRLRSTLRTSAETSVDGPETDCYVLGGNPLGVAIARQLHAAGHDVTFVDADANVDVDDLPTLRGDPRDVTVLSDAGVTETSTVVVATPEDGRNLLVAQLVRARFGVSNVFVVVHSPERFDLVAEAGHEPICATTVLADAVADGVRPRLGEVDG